MATTLIWTHKKGWEVRREITLDLQKVESVADLRRLAAALRKEGYGEIEVGPIQAFAYRKATDLERDNHAEKEKGRRTTEWERQVAEARETTARRVTAFKEWEEGLTSE